MELPSAIGRPSGVPQPTLVKHGGHLARLLYYGYKGKQRPCLVVETSWDTTPTGQLVLLDVWQRRVNNRWGHSTDQEYLMG